MDGTITTENKHAAGFVGQISNNNEKNDCIFTNCVSDITINSTVNGDGTHGGFVAEIVK